MRQRTDIRRTQRCKYRNVRKKIKKRKSNLAHCVRQGNLFPRNSRLIELALLKNKIEAKRVTIT